MPKQVGWRPCLIGKVGFVYSPFLRTDHLVAMEGVISAAKRGDRLGLSDSWGLPRGFCGSVAMYSVITMVPVQEGQMVLFSFHNWD